MSEENKFPDITENNVQEPSSNTHSASSGSSSGSSGSDHSSHHHHHHHHHHHSKKKKNKIRNTVAIVLGVVLLLIIITIFATNRNSDDDSSTQISNSQNTAKSSQVKDSPDVYYVGSSKDVNNRYNFSNVNDAIRQWRSQSKASELIIVRNTVTPEKVYRVGADKTFTTIIDAVKRWNADGQPSATIMVDSGTYVTTSDPSASKEQLNISPKNTNQLNIVGEDKQSTIVKATTGKYIHPAIMIKGGNVTIKNITFIADHTTNPAFTYREKKGYNSAYAVHCDGGTIGGGVVVFENCNMWSWQSCGLGCGTIQNSHIVVKNCDVRSFTESYAVDPSPQYANDQEEEEHAKYVHGSRGAIIYHAFSDAKGESNESFTLTDSFVYSKNGSHTVQVLQTGKDENSGFKILTFTNNVFSNDFNFCNNVVVPSGFNLSKNSSGNNLENINLKNGKYALTFEG